MALRVFTRFINYRYMTNADVNSKIILPNVFHQSGAYIRLCQTSTPTDDVANVVSALKDESTGSSEKKISKAMQIYLQRARNHEELMKKEMAIYDLGKRHLANMMGINVEEFTEQDIDRSIRYLFPSGLFQPSARPMMKHPDQLYPPHKQAEFDETGRPYHFLFYTIKKNYYGLLYECMETYDKLNHMEDKNILAGIEAKPIDKLDMSSIKWISKADLEKRMMETIKDVNYEYLIKTLQKLANHPYSLHAKDFINKYYIELATIGEQPLLPIEYDKQKRPYVIVNHCARKSSRGTVIVRGNGSGKITVNNQDITYFDNIQWREQIIFPLIFTDMYDKVDVEATVTGGGPNGQTGCIRWGIAEGLRSFVDEKMRIKMKIAGLLTKDRRRRERKKFGQEGARRKFTWKRR